MPPTLKSGSAYLHIEIPAGGDNPGFAPGTTIIGQVRRRSFLQRGIVKVKVTLYGRAKTRISISHTSYNGTNTTTRTDRYRSRCNFFTDGTQEVSQIIHDGPVDISAETREAGFWPFALTLPKYTHMKNHQGLDEYSFVPVTAQDIATHVLPDTCHSQGSSPDSGSKYSESYVEYFIEARMHMTGEDDIVATYPITVKSAADPNPISDFRLHRHPQAHEVHTYELQPKIQELTFTQKRREFFHSSKVPEFAFNLWVTRPTVVQLASKTPLPLYIKAAAIADKVSDAVKDIPQTLTLKSLTLKVKAHTRVVAPGSSSIKNNQEDMKYEAHIGPQILERLRNPITLTMAPESDAVNIGAILQMQLYSDGLYICDRRVSASGFRIAPAFTTYNMELTHELKWKLDFEVAGKEMDMRLQDKVTIISHAAPMEELPPYQPPPYKA